MYIKYGVHVGLILRLTSVRSGFQDSNQSWKVNNKMLKDMLIIIILCTHASLCASLQTNNYE